MFHVFTETPPPPYLTPGHGHFKLFSDTLLIARRFDELFKYFKAFLNHTQGTLIFSFKVTKIVKIIIYSIITISGTSVANFRDIISFAHLKYNKKFHICAP